MCQIRRIGRRETDFYSQIHKTPFIIWYCFSRRHEDIKCFCLFRNQKFILVAGKCARCLQYVFFSLPTAVNIKTEVSIPSPTPHPPPGAHHFQVTGLVKSTEDPRIVLGMNRLPHPPFPSPYSPFFLVSVPLTFFSGNSLGMG